MFPQTQRASNLSLLSLLASLGYPQGSRSPTFPAQVRDTPTQEVPAGSRGQALTDGKGAMCTPRELSPIPARWLEVLSLVGHGVPMHCRAPWLFF